MIKKNSIKKGVSFFIVFTMIFAMAAISVQAVSPFHIDTSKTGSIEFYKYEMEDTSEATTPGDGTVQAIPDGATPLSDVEFTAYKIADLDEYYTSAGKSLPTPAEAKEMVTSATPRRSAYTNEDGYIKLSDLALGIYYVEETYSPSQVRTKTAPFVVSVPSTNAGGTKWLYDISVQPKNETKYADVTVEKTDNATGAALGGFSFTLEEKIVAKDGTYAWQSVGDTYVTGEQGKFTVEHLATDRDFRFREVSATDKQYIVDSTVYYDFTVNADGTVTYNDETAIDNTITITNETPTVHKAVSTDKTSWGQDVTQDINKSVYWKIDVDIPKVIAKLETYKIIDTLCAGADFNSLEVFADDVTVATSDYKVTTEKTDANETVITIDITNKNALDGASNLSVILNTTLNTNAVIGGDNPNTANLIYTNDVDTSSTYTKNTETPEAHTGGYTFLKTDQNDNPLANAEFEVYRSLEDAEAGTNAILFEQGKDGRYYMSTAAAADATVTSNEDGFISLMGLSYGENGLTSAEGKTTYYVVETKSPSGYTLLQTPFEIEVDHSTHNYTDGVNVKVMNTQQAVFPVTGSKAAAMCIFGAGTFISLGVFLFFSKREKKSCEEK